MDEINRARQKRIKIDGMELKWMEWKRSKKIRTEWIRDEQNVTQLNVNR